MPVTDDFLQQVDLLYGHYLDCTIGFHSSCEMLLQGQAVVRQHHPEIDVDASALVIGFGGDPREPGHVCQHTTTQGEFKTRNSPGGENYVRASQNLIVLLYAYWDSGHREKIAQALGLKKMELEVPIMGDLRLLRNDIVHCKAVRVNDSETPSQRV